MRVIIPTDLKEIKLSQYLRYLKVLKDNQDDETFVCIQMVAIFCNLEVAVYETTCFRFCRYC